MSFLVQKESIVIILEKNIKKTSHWISKTMFGESLLILSIKKYSDSLEVQTNLRVQLASE